MKKQEDTHCASCFKIICKQCGWEASDEEVVQIQNETLPACPVCGWKPGNNISNDENTRA